jgi:hypothetical protein
MSVVAACSLFDGILLGADCRVTFRPPNRPEVFVDNCQKIFAIGPNSALGFVGSLEAAARILGSLCDNLDRRRSDGLSLLQWLPRLCRHEYPKVVPSGAQVDFLVASTVPGRLNFVRRQDAWDLLNYIGFGDRRFKTNWFDAKLARIVMAPPETERVYLGGTACNLLYLLRSPRFEPQFFRTLQHVAIGSGHDLRQDVHRLRDMIFASDCGNVHMEANWFQDAMQSFVRRRDEATVGGMFPMVKVRQHEVLALGSGSEGLFPGGHNVRLTYEESGSWIQRNLLTGKEIALIPPWDIVLNSRPGCSITFDDIRGGAFWQQRKSEEDHRDRSNV